MVGKIYKTEKENVTEFYVVTKEIKLTKEKNLYSLFNLTNNFILYTVGIIEKDNIKLTFEGIPFVYVAENFNNFIK